MGEIIEIGIFVDGIADHFHGILNDYNMAVSGIVDMECHTLRAIRIPSLTKYGGTFISMKDLLNTTPIHILSKI
jgi:hypothetical protein